MAAIDDFYERVQQFLNYIEEHDEVAYAEVGAVDKKSTNILLSNTQVRSLVEPEELGLWCRVFANGAVGYEYTTDLEREALQKTAETVIRSGKTLGQLHTQTFDQSSLHRDVHEGWNHSSERLGTFDAAWKIDKLQSAIDKSFGGLQLDRLRIECNDAQIDNQLLTTNGSIITSSLDQIGIGITIVPRTGPKIRRHIGTTTGPEYYEKLTRIFNNIAADIQEVGQKPNLKVEAADTQIVVLAPYAAGQLFHLISHYFEIDTVYLNSSPFEIGDRIAPTELSIHDTVHPGSWGARAYDAEARPVSPITLVSDGVVTNFMHTTASAIEEGKVPHGHLIPSIGFSSPPRVHTRNLDIDPGSSTMTQLLRDADVLIEQFHPEHIENIVTRTKRTANLPPSALYAKNVANQTPSGFGNEKKQSVEFPIRLGYALNNGAKQDYIENAVIQFSPGDLNSILGLSDGQETISGVCEKHGSQLPYSINSPAVKLPAVVKPR